MPTRRSKRARKSSHGPLEVEHLSLCGARGERGKRGMVVLERYYGTLKYLYDVLSRGDSTSGGTGAVARPSRAVLWGSGGALWGGIDSEFDKTTSQVHSL